jgi:hypothetical protein
MQCVTEMEVPRYSWIARGAVRDTGTVDVNFRIGVGGALEDFQSTSPDPRLSKEVESFLKAHMLFTFQMEGDPTHYPFTRFTFKPPNHFVITSQRTLPTVDYMPVGPNKPKQDKGKK